MSNDYKSEAKITRSTGGFTSMNPAYARGNQNFIVSQDLLISEYFSSKELVLLSWLFTMRDWYCFHKGFTDEQDRINLSTEFIGTSLHWEGKVVRRLLRGLLEKEAIHLETTRKGQWVGLRDELIREIIEEVQEQLGR